MKKEHIDKITSSSNVCISSKSEIDARYESEMKFIHAVTAGDKETALHLTHDVCNNNIFLHRIPSNPLRVLKNLVIGFNTKCRLAAYQGGANPLRLSIISEKFAVKIEKIQTKEELNLLQTNMVCEYCDAVKNFSTLNYSPLIKQAISYINLNLLDTVKLNELSTSLHCHPAHLSRQFKKETNITITAYINIERLTTAISYFKDGKTNITEVAHSVGFNDSNYFCRVFKKFNGITPRDYLKTLPYHSL